MKNVYSYKRGNTQLPRAILLKITVFPKRSPNLVLATPQFFLLPLILESPSPAMLVNLCLTKSLKGTFKPPQEPNKSLSPSPSQSLVFIATGTGFVFCLLKSSFKRNASLSLLLWAPVIVKQYHWSSAHSINSISQRKGPARAHLTTSPDSLEGFFFWLCF